MKVDIISVLEVLSTSVNRSCYLVKGITLKRLTSLKMSAICELHVQSLKVSRESSQIEVPLLGLDGTWGGTKVSCGRQLKEGGITLNREFKQIATAGAKTAAGSKFFKK